MQCTNLSKIFFMDIEEFKRKALPVEKMIRETLEANSWLIGDSDDKPSNWTAAVNSLLKKVAQELHAGCQIACKRTGDCSEWLYDFVCYTENDFGLEDVLFVAESQWMNHWHKDQNYKDILFDFEKLILARCQIRIMIFEANNETEIREYIGWLTKVVSLSKLTQTSDRYMFVGWNIEKEDFSTDLYIHG
jgi:hypothetical protein